ncbi:orotidine-5'-phosphate decarboxylase [Candidatus Gracilibacteria bacterium]|nr:orotidine-5'-phosphate decarboxylase [Candidatus Gracilibacteria bacterium]
MSDDKKIIVALDNMNETSALRMARSLNPEMCRLKVGKELFTVAGPQLVKKLIDELGFDVFLDLKYHDIPNTVAKAVKAAAELGVWMVNVHASGGSKMMLAARQALDEYQGDVPILIGVTVLTSMDEPQLNGVGVLKTPAQQVEDLATLASKCRLDGVVCSPLEVERLKEDCGTCFLAVTPGVRPAGANANDQARLATPEAAIANGADYLVIGRPITQADDPQVALEAIYTSIK